MGPEPGLQLALMHALTSWQQKVGQEVAAASLAGKTN